jgi:peptide/nickel transport system substrate-binding protein
MSHTTLRKTQFTRMLAFLVLLAILVAGCAPAATPTAAPQATEPPAAQTEAPAPTEPPAATEEPTEEPTTEPTQAPTEPSTPKTAARVRAAITGDESTITPYTYVTGFPGWNLLMMQYDSLYIIDRAGVPQPWLIGEAELSEDNRTYTLTLKENVTWNDGAPLTADDIKFTFDYFTANTQSRFTRDIRGYESSEVVDERTVKITLAKADPSYILTALADVPMLPKHIWETITTPAEHVFESVTNIGTGPYKLVEYQPDQFYRFEANTNYFAGQPTVQELVVVKFADVSSALAAFRTNEVDIIFPPVPPEQIELLGAIEGVSIAQGPQFTTQIIQYDMQKPPFDKLAVRQAIALALDRQDMVDTVYLGAATAGAAGWIHPASPLVNPNVSAEYDPEKARQLLEEAGIVDSDGDGIREFDGTPMTFELISPSADALRLRLAELAREMLLEIGIDLQVSAVEQTTWENAVWPDFDVNNGRNYATAMWGWSAPVQANASRITSLIHSDTAIGSLNLTGFVNEQADALSDQLLVETDLAKREQLIKDIQAVIAEQIPFIVLLYPDGIYAYWSSVYDGLVFITGQGVVGKLSFLPAEAQP